MSDVLKRVREVFQEIFAIEVDSSFSWGSLDALDLVQLVTSLEEEFEIEIEDADAMKWSNIHEVVDCVANRVLLKEQECLSKKN